MNKQLTTETMTSTDTQIVTKDNKKFTKFFLAECDYFGYIEPGIFKEVEVPYDENCTSMMTPFEYDYTKAINSLHEWIIENNGIVEFSKAKWNIYLVDGSFNKYDEIKLDKVYSISSAKAKKLLK